MGKVISIKYQRGILEGTALMPGVSNFGNGTPIVRLTSIEFGNRLRGRGVLPYITYVAMCHPIGYGFAPFGLKTGIDFAHFGLELGMVFAGTTGVYGRIYRFNFK